jgi:putative methionine-R-sulfoxide reductase with GAF domain
MLWKEEKKALELFVYRGVGPSLVEMCSLVPLGRCLCGRAAQKRSIVFKDCVDEEHDNRPVGITPHGHYNIPLMYKGKLLGVLFLYLEEHQKKTTY